MAAIGQGPLRAGSPLRTPRAAAVAGIIFSVLLITGLVLLRVSAPARDNVAGAWLTDSGGRAEVAIALNLVPFAGIAFLWFIGVLRDRIGEREDRFFATVFLGSGVSWPPRSDPEPEPLMTATWPARWLREPETDGGSTANAGHGTSPLAADVVRHLDSPALMPKPMATISNTPSTAFVPAFPMACAISAPRK